MFKIFIYYGNESFCKTLSESDTVEDLQYAIYEQFKVRIKDQDISGWENVPSSDRTALLELNLQSETVLFLKDKKKNKMSLNCISNEPMCSSNTFGDTKEADVFQGMDYQLSESPCFSDINDLNASILFNLYYADNFSSTVPFYTGTFVQAIEAAFLKDDSTKCMFLYLHKDDSSFSKTFCKNLMNDVVIEMVRSNLFLGWNIGDEVYVPVLKNTIYNNLSLAVAKDIESFLLRGQPALILLGFVEKEIIVTNVYQLCIENIDDFICHLSTMLTIVNDMSGYHTSFGSRQFQQNMCDSLGNRDYDRFIKSEYERDHYLFDKVGFALYGPPTATEDDKKYGEKQMKQITDICKKLIENGNCLEKYGEINIAFLYNCIEPLDSEKKKRAKKYTDYDWCSDMTPMALFCIRRCQGSADPCRHFIDSSGRVYKSWNAYLKKNKETKCKLILPQNGRYAVNECEKVLLEERLSNDQRIISQMLFGADVTSTGLGLGSTAVMIGAAIPAIPVAPIVLTGALATGAVVGVYSIARSISTIFDRGIHDETLCFSNSEARSAYINIVAGSLGFVGAGATQAMSLLATRGVNIGQGARIAVNVLNGTNIAVGGVNVINQSYAIYENYVDNKQPPSALMVLQLGTSILFFGHSVYNFRMAGTIVDEAQMNKMQEINDSMRSNRHRKTFDKYTKETIRLSGDARAGRAEVIQSISKMQNKDEVFAFLTRNNKSFNKDGVRFAADVNSGVKLNGVRVNVAEIINMTPSNRATLFTDLPNIPANSSSSTVSTIDGSNFMELLQTTFGGNVQDMIRCCGRYLLENPQWQTICADLIKHFSRLIQQKLINIVTQYLKCDNLSVAALVSKYFPNFDKFYIVLKATIEFLKIKGAEHEEIYQRKRTIAERSPQFNEKEFDSIYFPLQTANKTLRFFEKAVNMCYMDTGVVLTHIINELDEYLAKYFTNKEIFDKEKQDRTPEEASVQRSMIACEVCRGYYFNDIE